MGMKRKERPLMMLLFPHCEMIRVCALVFGFVAPTNDFVEVAITVLVYSVG